jgi:hypothetical protein
MYRGTCGLIQATTHSDFFINGINNLLKLHFLKNKDHNKFLAALKQTGIREEFVLDPHNVGAYYFEKVKDGDTVQVKDRIILCLVELKSNINNNFKKAIQRIDGSYIKTAMLLSLLYNIRDIEMVRQSFCLCDLLYISSKV